MTSNGLILHRHLDELVKNGMTHLNLRYIGYVLWISLLASHCDINSLDTLDPFKFEIMTRRMGHEAVLRSLRQALANPLLQVKLNVVVMKGVNDAEVLQFVEMTKDQPLSVRFIEFMPFTGKFAHTGFKTYVYIRQSNLSCQETNGTRIKCYRPLNSNLGSAPFIPAS